MNNNQSIYKLSNINLPTDIGEQLQSLALKSVTDTETANYLKICKDSSQHYSVDIHLSGSYKDYASILTILDIKVLYQLLDKYYTNYLEEACFIIDLDHYFNLLYLLRTHPYITYDSEEDVNQDSGDKYISFNLILDAGCVDVTHDKTLQRIYLPTDTTNKLKQVVFKNLTADIFIPTAIILINNIFQDTSKITYHFVNCKIRHVELTTASLLLSLYFENCDIDIIQTPSALSYTDNIVINNCSGFHALKFFNEDSITYIEPNAETIDVNGENTIIMPNTFVALDIIDYGLKSATLSQSSTEHASPIKSWDTFNADEVEDGEFDF